VSERELFPFLVAGWSALAVVVFVALFFVAAPYGRFAERARMAERTHPDAAGQALIARELAGVVERQPSFRAWLDRL